MLRSKRGQADRRSQVRKRVHRSADGVGTADVRLKGPGRRPLTNAHQGKGDKRGEQALALSRRLQKHPCPPRDPSLLTAEVTRTPVMCQDVREAEDEPLRAAHHRSAVAACERAAKERAK